MKIAPFYLVQYERVVIIDADMVVASVSLFKTLFHLSIPPGHIAAARDCAALYLKGRPTNEIQGGLMVITPSNETAVRLKTTAATAYSVDLGGQGYFTTVFADKVVWLPLLMNLAAASKCIWLSTLTTGVAFIDADLRRTATAKGGNCSDLVETNILIDELLSTGRIGVVHYHYIPKPSAQLMIKDSRHNWVAGCTGSYLRGTWSLWTSFAQQGISLTHQFRNTTIRRGDFNYDGPR